MEDINKLQTFVCVADGRSFTDAARRLHMTPSAVSKQIADLEARLGLVLFHRSTRGVSLTEIGEALYGQCTRALGSIDDAIAAAQGFQRAPQGTLRLHVISGFAQWVLAPLLPRFMALYPSLQLEVTTSTPALSLVKAGADLVVSGKTMPDSGLAFRDLGPVPYVICATPDYLRAHPRPRRPQDLLRHNCLRHTIFAPKSWPFVVARRNIAVRVQGNFVSNSSEVLRQVTLQGWGVARLPLYTVQADIDDGRLESLFPGEVRTIQHMRVYFPPGRSLPAKTTSFLDFLDHEFAPAKAAPKRRRAALAPSAT